MSQKDIFGTKGAGEYLGLHSNTLEQWRLEGKGPTFCKMGRTVRYRKQDLDKFIERSLVQSTSEINLD